MVSYLCPTHVGGAEEHAHQIIRALRGIGEDVTLAVSKCPHSESYGNRCVSDEEVAAFDASCGYPVERIDTLVSSGQWKNGGRWKALKDRLVLTRRIYRLVKSLDAEYIIVNLVPAAWSLSCLIAARWARVPVIQVVHNSQYAGAGDRRAFGRAHALLTPFLLGRFDRVVCVRRFYGRSSTRSQRTRRTRLSCTTESTCAKLRRGSSPGVIEKRSSANCEIADCRDDVDSTSPHCFTLSRLVERKGVQHTIAALPSIFEKYPDACLLIGGEGPHRSELEI